MARSAPTLSRGVDPKREARLAADIQMFPTGSHTFRAPRTGRYKFVLWGGGSRDASGGGASGSYAEYTRQMSAGETAAVSTGFGVNAPSPATASTVTFSDGKVVTAGAANGTTPGVATGGDVNLSGSVGGVDATSSGTDGSGTGGGVGGALNTGVGGGAGAPANLPFRGGKGGSVANGYSGGTPGGGAVSSSYGGGNITGGNGLVLAVQVS